MQQYTQEQRHNVLASVMTGMSINNAAITHNVKPSAAYYWIREEKNKNKQTKNDRAISVITAITTANRMREQEVIMRALISRITELENRESKKSLPLATSTN